MIEEINSIINYIQVEENFDILELDALKELGNEIIKLFIEIIKGDQQKLYGHFPKLCPTCIIRKCDDCYMEDCKYEDKDGNTTLVKDKQTEGSEPHE